jgi:RNA polymerase sigma factor (sigma-70 family)
MGAAGIAAVNTVVATDTDLVAAVRAGDDVAFEELYRRYYPRIAAFVRGYLRDNGRAEDVTQEAFMSALRRLRQTDSEINFKPWIFEIARNGAIDQYRRNGRTDEVSIDIEGGFAPSDVSRVVRPRGPDSSMLDKQRLDHLRGALDELSETHHRIIVMRELEGLSYREIGEKMELTPAAVESTLFRARRKLEHEYAQLDTGRRCQLMGAVMGRLAEGLDSDRDRRRLDRHARRCSSCRRRARQLGVEPMLPRRSIAARAAALLPLPLFLRRRIGGHEPGITAHAAAPAGALGAPTIEAGAAVAGKAVAVVAAVAITGAGGAGFGGVGALEIGGNGDRALEQQQRKQAAPAREAPAAERGIVRPHEKGKAATEPWKAGDASAPAADVPEKKPGAAAAEKPKAADSPGVGDLPSGLLSPRPAPSSEPGPSPAQEPSSQESSIELPDIDPAQISAPAGAPDLDALGSSLGGE